MAAEDLADGPRRDLMERVEALTYVLELAEQGSAPSGWSSDEAVVVVGDLCGPEGLTSWTVQP